MAYMKFALFVFLICISFVITCTEEISEEMSWSAEEARENIKDLETPDSPSWMIADHFQDLMLEDATQGTTPSVCTPNMTCGFQEYEDHPTHYDYYPFFRYCHCPDDYGCVATTQNYKSRFFYFTCQELKHLNDSEVNTSGTDGGMSISSITEHSVVTYQMNFRNESDGESETLYPIIENRTIRLTDHQEP